MQLFLKRIQHDVGITFVHVTHDQEEAMTMADRIAVMNKGRIEQLGTPSELYETPETAFVAGFLGISNLLQGTIAGDDVVRLDSGAELRVPADRLHGRSGRVAVGVRPEKIAVGDAEANVLQGEVQDRAYVGVATQYVVQTAAGAVAVYVQNALAGVAAHEPGTTMSLSFNPDATFVVEAGEEEPA
jgi:spermidine/putrescine transport system ATP-binding protein